MSSFFTNGPPPWNVEEQGPRPQVKVSVRTVKTAVESALMATFNRSQLETLLPEELGLTWGRDDLEPQDSNHSKRDVIQGYTRGWALPQLVQLLRRLTAELELSGEWGPELQLYIDAYERGGGVAGSSKNLIFAANGPKPDLVLSDALNNEISIVANAEHCLVYEQPIPPEGLWFSHLISWWRKREHLPDTLDDRAVGHALHTRLSASLDREAERVVFDTYATRYRASYDIPALIPQVYLHYDPVAQGKRRASAAGTPLARQRMDFLLLFSSSQRVVIEVDGKQHYAEGSTASPRLYSEMVAEDRRLRLTGYEVYRFGGHELTQDPDSAAMVRDFFEQLATRMK